MSYSIREMRKEEYSLLSDFLYEAIYIPDGTAAPPKSVITCPELQVYIADFGNSKHDKALIVEVDGNIVGVEYGKQLGFAFHPELDGDFRIHQRFVDKL